MPPARGGGGSSRQAGGVREMSDSARRSGDVAPGEGDGDGGEGKSSGPPTPRRRSHRKAAARRLPGEGEGEGEEDFEPSSADESGPLLARVSRGPDETLRDEIMHLYQVRLSFSFSLESSRSRLPSLPLLTFTSLRPRRCPRRKLQQKRRSRRAISSFTTST